MRNLTIAMLLIALPCISHAQSSNRYAGTWDVSVSALQQQSMDFSGENGSSLKVNSDLGFGLNFAYNLNPNFSVGMDLEYVSPKYSASLTGETGEDFDINHSFSQWNTRFKGTWNFVDGPITPYIDGGIGWSFFDSNVADGPPQTGCYWHPYWGYICNNYYSTFSDTLFSYGGGAGLRFEFGSGGFMKASYNYWKMDGVGESGSSALTSGKLEIGMSF